MPVTVLRENTRPVPSYCAQILSRFGNNPYGQSIFRVVWGPSRMEVLGGLWGDGSREYRRVSRYHQECYVLEKWVPARLYGTPTSWNESQADEWGFLGSGPYPEHGDYETSHIFQLDGEYVHPTPELLYLIAEAIDRGKLWSLSDKRIALRDAKERKEAEWRNRVHEEFSDLQSPFTGPTQGYGARSLAKRAEDMDFSKTTAALPAKLREADTSVTQL